MKELNERKMKRIVSGIKPTGRPHLGNYFGMMKSVVEMQDEYESFLFVADYHALTTIHKKEELHDLTVQLILDYLAVGVDPKKTVFYLQSAIPELAELAWILSSLVTVPWLERAHAYKDALAKGREAGVALFSYPILMAADILATSAELVPVGKDQIQHVEMTRELARKFNSRYEKIFTEPKSFLSEGQVVPGIDGQKMSKSYGNIIPLFADEKIIRKSVMRIVTDSLRPEDPKNPETCNVFALHKLITPSEELDEIREAYLKGGVGYAESKERLFKNVMSFTEEMRARRAFYEEHMELVYEIINEGNERARGILIPLIEKVREAVGILS